MSTRHDAATADAARQEAAWFSQAPYRCRLEWGRRGAKAAAGRGDLLVVVDTLTFSTAVATAVRHSVSVYPCRPDDAEGLARDLGAAVAVKRSDVPRHGRFSLSPLTYLDAEPGTKVVLGSPNGRACCLPGSAAAGVVVGALVNARAVASFVAGRLAGAGVSVTLLACGERWLTPSPGEEVRFAVEDYLGAGAILSFLGADKSPEARVCEAGFRAVQDRLEATLLDCGSGRELDARGYRGDVLHAARVNLYDTVPILEQGRFIDARPTSPGPER